jgi:hypothetical protein
MHEWRCGGWRRDGSRKVVSGAHRELGPARALRRGYGYLLAAEPRIHSNKNLFQTRVNQTSIRTLKGVGSRVGSLQPA